MCVGAQLLRRRSALEPTRGATLDRPHEASDGDEHPFEGRACGSFVASELAEKLAQWRRDGCSFGRVEFAHIIIKRHLVLPQLGCQPANHSSQTVPTKRNRATGSAIVPGAPLDAIKLARTDPAMFFTSIVFEVEVVTTSISSPCWTPALGSDVDANAVGEAI